MKLTLTIGIAAYNEEANIGSLIEALLKQKIDSANLQEILVVSDASSDKTDAIVSSYVTRGPVRLIRLPERSGQNQGQNRIHTEARSDVLVVLDADMLPANEHFIEKLITPIFGGDADLVGVQLMPATPITFFEKMLAEIHLFKVRLYERSRGGKNIYMCFGPARSFSKRLYTKLQYPNNCPTDAYSYLFAKHEGYIFTSIANPPAIFKVPTNLADHLRQSSRFASGKETLAMQFGKEVVRKEFAISPILFGRALLYELVTHPIYLTLFVIINLRVRLLSRGKVFTSRWEMATSTKAIKRT